MKTINRKIHATAVGTSGRMLFSIDFEPYYPKKRYYSVMESLYQNEELKNLFGEEVSSLFIEEEKTPDDTERGFYEGLTLSIYPGGSYGKIVNAAKELPLVKRA